MKRKGIKITVDPMTQKHKKKRKGYNDKAKYAR